MIGEIISHYKILEEIGSGGMGVVYKAEDTKLKRTVALKFLPPEFSRDKEAKKRFIHEAQAAATLNHPNIVTIHEINEHDNQTYIAMEYVEGKTLKEIISGVGAALASALKSNGNDTARATARVAPTIHETLNITTQICLGLQKAHASGIVHRDIKPANIIITDDGVAKILDFGLAKLKGQTKLTKEQTTLGTIAYMSPEQTTGDEVDQRSDIWSLGVVFYEMLSGQLPFRGHYEQAIMYSILNEEPEPIKELIPEIPEQLERIINKMLAKAPGKRYQEINQLLLDLKHFIKGSGTDIPLPKTKPEILVRFTRRSAFLTVLVVAVIIAAAYFIFKGKTNEIPSFEPGSQPSLAVVYFENKSGDENLDNWREAFSELLTTDLSQSRYLRVLRSDEVYGIFEKLNLLEAKRYSAQNLMDIAQNGRVNHVLKGSYIKAGDNFVITAMLINADSGETMSSLSVRAEGEKNIFPKVDELTREIKLKLELSEDQIADDVDGEIGQITTSSPQAMKHYLEGRRYLASSELSKSVECMKKAIEIDPEFAMAYRSMAIASNYLGYSDKFVEYNRKAMELSHRLPHRERYIIEGFFYWLRDKPKAIEAYQKVLELYPHDSIANNNLGNIYAYLEQWEKYRERYEVLQGVNPEDPGPYTDIALSYQGEGMYEKAGEVLENYLTQYKDDHSIRRWLAINHTIQIKFELALIEIERAISLGENRWRTISRIRKGDIWFLKGDFIEAENFYQEFLEDPTRVIQVSTLFSLGCLCMTQGRITEAENQFEQALKIAQENQMRLRQQEAYQFIGYIHFITGSYDESLKEYSQALILANKSASLGIRRAGLFFTAMSHLKLDSQDQTQRAETELLNWANRRYNKKLLRWYYLFLGEKELSKKNPEEAIVHLEKAVALMAHQNGKRNFYQPLFFDPLARAYLDSGNLEKALDAFEKITGLTYGRLETGDLYAKAFYNLGKIYQQKGWKGKAIDSYNKFIELWKDCDPLFQPMVEDAREQVKKLEGGV